MAVVLDTPDIDAAHAMLDQMYGRVRLTVFGTHLRSRIARDAVGPAELHQVDLGMRIDVHSPPLGALSVGLVRTGTVTCERAGVADDLVAGDVALIGRPEDPYHIVADALGADLVLIPPAVLDRVACAAPGRTAVPLAFTGFRPVTPAAALLLTETCGYVRRNAALLAAQPLVADAAVRLLASVALGAFPNNALRDPTIEDRHDAHPATLRRAIAFIDDNAQRPISLADVAGAAHVSIRTVQLVFRRHLGVTPTSYLRRVRLEHAHRDLLAADPHTSTVTAIAARWGFANHSRFTAIYRAAYGVTPSRVRARG